MLCNTGYDSAVYSGRLVDMLRHSRARACFKETGMPAAGCRRFLAAFYFAGVKVVRRFIRFQSGGDGNGYFAMPVCGGFRCIRIVTVQVERIFPGGVVHFVPSGCKFSCPSSAYRYGRFCKYGVLKLLSLMRNMPILSPVFRAVPSMTFRLTVASTVHTDAFSRTSTALSSPGRGTVAVSASHPASSRSARLKRYDMFFFLLITQFLFFVRVRSAFTRWVRLRDHRPVSMWPKWRWR